MSLTPEQQSYMQMSDTIQALTQERDSLRDENQRLRQKWDMAFNLHLDPDDVVGGLQKRTMELVEDRAEAENKRLRERLRGFRLHLVAMVETVDAALEAK